MDGLIIDLLSIALRKLRRRLIGRGETRVTPAQTYAGNAGIIETKSTNIEHNMPAADARALALCTTHGFVIPLSVLNKHRFSNKQAIGFSIEM